MDDKCKALHSAFAIAAKDGQTEIVELLLEAGADVHAWEDIALRLAADQGHVETVETLLDAGADAHARGDEALAAAVENGHDATARVLRAWSGAHPPRPQG